MVDNRSTSHFLDYSSTASLSLFGHIVRLDDGADAKKILTAFPPEDRKRPPGHWSPSDYMDEDFPK